QGTRTTDVVRCANGRRRTCLTKGASDRATLLGATRSDAPAGRPDTTCDRRAAPARSQEPSVAGAFPRQAKETHMELISKRLATTVAALGLMLGIVAAAAPAHAAAPANIRCAVAKRKAAVKELRVIDACFAKRAPDAPDPTCLASAHDKLQKEFVRI